MRGTKGFFCCKSSSSLVRVFQKLRRLRWLCLIQYQDGKLGGLHLVNARFNSFDFAFIRYFL